VGDRRAKQVPFRVASPPPRVDARLSPGDVRFVQHQPHPPFELERLESGWLAIDLQTGSPRAFAELHQRYYAAIHRFLARRLLDVHGAEEATQEVFFRAIRGLPSFDASRGGLGRWLFAIARNYVLDQARRPNRISLVPHEELWDFDQAERGPAHEFHGGDSGFHDVIASLPLAQRQVLLLRYVMDLSWEEIARALGRSSGAVRMLQHRAHEDLRGQMATHALSNGG
jgi:RNA polymerase sigma-70 factor (ECF subfamily)